MDIVAFQSGENWPVIVAASVCGFIFLVRYGGSKKQSYRLHKKHSYENVSKLQTAFEKACEEHDGYPTSCIFIREGKVIFEEYASRQSGEYDYPRNDGKLSEEECLSTVQSVSKVIMGLAVAILEDRGHLSYNDTIKKHWPEFKSEATTIQDILSHTAKLHALSPEMELDLFGGDREQATKYLSEQMPKKDKAGEESTINYHSISGGWFISEVIKRVDPKGRYLNQFIREEIFEPLGIEESANFGLTNDQFQTKYNGRYILHPVPPMSAIFLELIPLSVKKIFMKRNRIKASVPLSAMQSFCYRKPLSLHLMDTKQMLVSEHGSANLITNVSTLGVIGQLIVNDGIMNGKQLISSGALQRASETAVEGFDTMFQTNATFSKAGWSRFAKFSVHANVRDHRDLIGWWGVGGQLFLFSQTDKVVFAFQSTYLAQVNAPDMPAFDVLSAALDVR